MGRRLGAHTGERIPCVSTGSLFRLMRPVLRNSRTVSSAMPDLSGQGPLVENNWTGGSCARVAASLQFVRGGETALPGSARLGVLEGIIPHHEWVNRSNSFVTDTGAKHDPRL